MNFPEGTLNFMDPKVHLSRLSPHELLKKKNRKNESTTESIPKTLSPIINLNIEKPKAQKSNITFDLECKLHNFSPQSIEKPSQPKPTKINSKYILNSLTIQRGIMDKRRA